MSKNLIIYFSRTPIKDAAAEMKDVVIGGDRLCILCYWQ